MTQEELKEGIDFSIKTQGIAYTYRNEVEGEDGKPTLGDEILLNPMNVRAHSHPMAVYYKDMILAVGTQPLVFSNAIKAEGAVAVIELLYPDLAFEKDKEGRMINSFITTKVYDEKATLKDLQSSLIV